MSDSRDLNELARRSIDAFNALPHEQQEEMLRRQRDSWVRGEMELSRLEKAQPATPAPAASDELVESMRRLGDAALKYLPPDLRPGPDDKPPLTIWHEAAARIEADAAEIARYKRLLDLEASDHDQEAQRATAAEAERDALREAAEAVDESAVIFGPNGDEAVSFAAMAKLRAALAAKSAGGRGCLISLTRHH